MIIEAGAAMIKAKRIGLRRFYLARYIPEMPYMGTRHAVTSPI
jgi:hypothetical protein